jgi:hypothetical protein
MQTAPGTFFRQGDEFLLRDKLGPPGKHVKVP